MSFADLCTRELTVRFGGHVAVNHVSCEFHRGTLTAIVGPNGAGKTTYFNLISGQIEASAGEVWMSGKNITTLSAAQKARAGIGRAFQLTNLFPNLSVLENVRLAVQAMSDTGYDLRHIANRCKPLIEKAQFYLSECALLEKQHDLAANLSHGDQRKLEVAILMALEPQVYMFDEPTAGMSVDDAPVILELIAKLKSQQNKTILLVEHKMDVVRTLADRIIVLHQGELVADGDPDAIIASPIVQQAYLGLDVEENSDAA